MAVAQLLAVAEGVPVSEESAEAEPESVPVPEVVPEAEALPLSLWDVLPVAQTELVEDCEGLGEPLEDRVAVTDIEGDCDADEHDESDGEDEGHGLGDCDEEVDTVAD